MDLGDFFYIKRSLGQNGKPIDVYKIRTMRSSGEVSTDLDLYGKPLCGERPTRMGRILRKYWIDELPQLYNWAIGDLKLVGIRPMEFEKWSPYPSDIKERALRQKPGLIGVQYSCSNVGLFEDHCDLLREYLDGSEGAPIKTDLKYFGLVLFNILFRGVRSS